MLQRIIVRNLQTSIDKCIYDLSENQDFRLDEKRSEICFFNVCTKYSNIS
jgi:hypothetical protein